MHRHVYEFICPVYRAPGAPAGAPGYLCPLSLKMKSMKRLFASSLLTLALSPVFAQVRFGPGDPLKHSLATSNIQSSPGIAGGHYYVVYCDYGAQFDLKYNIDTYLNLYSLKRDRLEKAVYLNPLLSSDLKKVFVDQVFLWKSRFFVLYTLRVPVGSDFILSGQLLDLDGKKVGQSVDFGNFPFAYRYATAPGQYAVVSAGRNTLKEADGFRCAFNSDSSRMILYTLVKGNHHTVRFVEIDPDLQVVGHVDCDLTIDPKDFKLLSFRQYENGPLYALIREDRSLSRKHAAYDLFDIDPESGKANKIPVTLSGKIILDAAFTFDDEGKGVVTGTYCDAKGHGLLSATHGAFAMTLPRGGHQITHTATFDFTPEMVEKLHGKKAASKDKGLEGIVQLQGVFPLSGNRIAVMGQSHVSAMVKEGQTGALNKYFDEYRDVVFYEIGPSGDVTWAGGVDRGILDPILSTHTAPIFLDTHAGKVQVWYDAKKKENHHRPAVYRETYGEDGTDTSRMQPLEGPDGYHSKILWATAKRVDDHRVIAAYYNLNKEMGVIDITFP